MTDATPSSAWLQRETGERVAVTGNCSIGRAVGNDVVLVDDRVSRRHATIHAQGENEFWLVDLGSRNGTYLNSRRINHPTRLRDSDRVQVGPFALLFRQPTVQAGEATATTFAQQTQMDLRTTPCWLLLCDITGSSTLAREKPGEELAMLVGGWFARCKEVIEDSGGVINKYLGDGFLAYWLSREEALAHVAHALLDLQRLQEEQRPPFRLVLHYGQVMFGGMPSSGEESLAGPELNFVFRLERLGSELRQSRVASSAAVGQLGSLLSATAAGEHSLHGFEGRHAVFVF